MYIFQLSPPGQAQVCVGFMLGFVGVVIPSGVWISGIRIVNIGVESLAFDFILGIWNFSVWLMRFWIFGVGFVLQMLVVNLPFSVREKESNGIGILVYFEGKSILLDSSIFLAKLI